MYRFTTPTLPITIEDIDFSLVNNFRIAIEQKSKEDKLFIVSASDARVDAENKTIYLSLTQEETADFNEGEAKLQVRIVYANGSVQATRKARITINDVIDEVIV